jgi:SAM-dependent methyltransferase
MKEEINLRKALAERDRLKAQLRAVRNSFSFQLGNMLVQAVYKPGRNTILLPYRLIHLVFAEFRKRRTSIVNVGKYTEVRLSDMQLNYDTGVIKEEYTQRFGMGNSRHGWYRADYWRRFEYVSSLLPEAKSILDVGLNNGVFLNLLIESGRFERIMGIDIMQHPHFTMLFNRQLYEIMYASVAYLPFADKSIDLVTCMEVLEHLDQKPFLAALPELRRVANQLLIITVPYNEPEPLYRGHKRRFNDSDLLTYFPRAEFTLLKKSTSPDWMAIVEHF